MASTHKHIRSSTASKRPTTAIADGQIALNTNAASAGLFFKDSTGATIIKVGPVHVGTTAPNVTPAAGGSSGNSTGEVWLDTSLTPVGVKIWNGSAWVNATPIGSTTVQGLLELATDAETQAGSDSARAVTPAGLQSKVSDSVSTTSSTTIASSTAVKTAYDLANAALPKAGGTITGNLEIGTTGSLTFEGSTADGNETTLSVADPTADRTIRLPNQSGDVLVSGNASIVNADISASAAIADTKLATISTAGKVSNSATTATSANTPGAIVARDISNNFSAGTITANLTGTASGNLPLSGGTLTGQLLSSAGSVSAPGIASSGDTNTGLWWESSDRLVAVAGGTRAAYFNTTEQYNYGSIFLATLDDASASGTTTTLSSNPIYWRGKYWNGTASVSTDWNSLYVPTDTAGNGEWRLRNGTTNRLVVNNSGTVTATTFSGSGASLTSLNASNLSSGTLPDARLSGTYTGVNITGNAATATTLATARTINGVSFNGSANINVPDLRGDNGTVLIDGTGVTSAVNYISLTNAATGGTPTLSTAGSDTNIALNLTTKGTGSVSITTGGGNIALRPTAGSILFYDATNTYYTNLDNGSLTANRTLTMPNGNVTLVSGTMVPTTGTGATGSWAISVTGSSASCTGNSATATTAASCTGNSATATTATNANNVALTASSTASAFKVPFANTTGTSTGNFGLLHDSASTFTYNPSTNVLTVGTVSGALSGNATTATTATNLSGGSISATTANLTSRLYVGHTSSSYPNPSGCSLFPEGFAHIGNSGGQTGWGFLNFYRIGAMIGNISQNGTAQVNYNITSDYRLKENVLPILDGISRLKALKPCRFNFISEKDRTIDGFLAHEVQEVVPSAVTGEKDAVDENDKPVYQSMDNSKLLPLLTAALKEAVDKIESLEARLAAAGL